MSTFIDGQGISFAEYRDHLPKRAADFPPPERVKDPDALRQVHFVWDHCQVCGRGKADGVRLEAHHITAGTKGRSDERCNLICLCAGGTDTCHENVKTPALPQAAILWAKWRTDRFGTDWVRLAVLSRHHLPDPAPARELAETYNRRRLRYPPIT